MFYDLLSLLSASRLCPAPFLSPLYALCSGQANAGPADPAVQRCALLHIGRLHTRPLVNVSRPRLALGDTDCVVWCPLFSHGTLLLKSDGQNT